MNYSAMIQNRKSVRSFRSKEVASESIGEIRTYFDKECMRLFPEIETQLVIVGGEAQKRWRGLPVTRSILSAHRIIWYCCRPLMKTRGKTLVI